MENEENLSVKDIRSYICYCLYLYYCYDCLMFLAILE